MSNLLIKSGYENLYKKTYSKEDIQYTFEFSKVEKINDLRETIQS